MDLRIPETVRPVIENYVLLMQQQLPDLINAVYLVGSIALGEFNVRLSDIDFITVLNQKAASTEIEKLRGIHQFIEKNHPRWKMSGSYIQPGELGRPERDIEPYPHFHDGVLQSAARNGLNSVTWWELKNHGIAVVGDDPQELSFNIDGNLLIRTMQENLNSYWMSWTKSLSRVILMYLDWGIQWAVPGVLRQFYTFRENSIITKVRAAEYALGCVAPRWHPLIQEAINIRIGKKKSAYRFRITRTIEAVNFLNYIIRICNRCCTSR